MLLVVKRKRRGLWLCQLLFLLPMLRSFGLRYVLHSSQSAPSLLPKTNQKQKKRKPQNRMLISWEIVSLGRLHSRQILRYSTCRERRLQLPYCGRSVGDAVCFGEDEQEDSTRGE